jgi:hypothetical protein
MISTQQPLHCTLYFLLAYFLPIFTSVPTRVQQFFLALSNGSFQSWECSIMNPIILGIHKIKLKENKNCCPFKELVAYYT